jgi:hypothetical protein
MGGALVKTDGKRTRFRMTVTVRGARCTFKRGGERGRDTRSRMSVLFMLPPPPVMQLYIPVSELWGAVPGTNTGLNLGAGSWWAPIPDGLNIQ